MCFALSSKSKLGEGQEVVTVVLLPLELCHAWV